MLGCKCLIQKKAGKTNNRIQRGAQLMRHIGHEVRLGLSCRFRGLLRLYQLRFKLSMYLQLFLKHLIG